MENSESFKRVSVAEAAALLEDAPDTVLIDVREDDEYAEGHILNAIHSPLGFIDSNIESITMDKNKTLLLYCRGGFRSAKAAASLAAMGYTNVISMDGGLSAWGESDLPVEM
jgi:rhodanese-related sulfurtransferase